MSSPSAVRYTGVAIALHWAMALLLMFMIWLGWNMDDNEARYQLHKSVGITLLFLTLARIAWRVFNPPPPLPQDVKPYERGLSHLVQVGFYVLMIVIPLAGWLLVSISPFQISTVLFGAIDWPHLPFTSGLRSDGDDLLHVIVENVHSKGAWVMIALLGLHVAGALKHEFSGEEGVLKRVLPGLFGKAAAPASPPRGALIAFGGSLLLFALVAALPMLSSGNRSTQADPLIGAEAQGNWEIDYGASAIRFSGVYDGKPFGGTFQRWTADVRFDPGDLPSASATVTVDTGSASTGTRLYDSTLREPEWFNAAAFPQAKVQLSDFQEDNGGYQATATMTLKGREVSVPLSFTLQLQGEDAVLAGSAVFSRQALDLGQSSDPDAGWVSDEITVTIEGEATRRD